MMTHGAAQQTGKQTGTGTAPPPPFSECLDFIFSLALYSLLAFILPLPPSCVVIRASSSVFWNIWPGGKNTGGPAHKTGDNAVAICMRIREPSKCFTCHVACPIQLRSPTFSVNQLRVLVNLTLLNIVVNPDGAERLHTMSPRSVRD